MEFKKANTSDLEALLQIDTIVPSDPTRSEYITTAVASNDIWVCLRDHKIVGYAVLNHSLFNRPTVDMLMIAVEHRKSGIGTEFMKHLEKLNDRDELWTSTNLSNSPMQRLLACLDYKLTGYVDNLDPGDPELIFYKKLRKA